MTEQTTTSKHTPGEWTPAERLYLEDSSALDHEAIGVVDADLRLIAYVLLRKGEYKAVGEANARLIAAAPEMYEALKVAIDALHSWNALGFNESEAVEINRLYDQSPEIRGIVAAIAKAEGRS